MIDQLYAVKANNSTVICLETYFLKFYNNIKILPKLVYVEPSKKYFVYSFIEGEIKSQIYNKSYLLQKLVISLINQYRSISHFKGWGWAENLVDSWEQFLIENIDYSKERLKITLTEEDYLLVRNLASNFNAKDKYFLHGDCGIHNFIFCEKHLCAVIDPTPIVGEPIYDLLYAFCSSPDDLTIETLNTAINYLKINNYEKDVVYKYVLIILYNRIATCTEHHPQDLSKYLEAWNYWKSFICE
ncbi:aminoglycoside phosphotransferase family protein [Senegalia massiliensis]|uniref:aminoglycoside phosphotransferase family protein n=1 Tax=Senegalia massiliensis TaxID=1720316 RepID=UPI0010318DCE|nr:aminoglycoside phosphotransferase family protein [Senegalia massiliensis]